MIHIKQLFLLLLVFVFVKSQGQVKLKIEGEAPAFFLSHTVKPKDTWFSLGRNYNLTPKELATQNGSTLEAGLKIDQVLKIPLQTSTNFVQSLEKATDEALIPLYHTIKEKEWMFRVSVQFNKVAVDKLEQWNKIKSEQVRPGMQLIVGFLKVKSAQSGLVSLTFTTEPTAATQEKHLNTEATSGGQEVQPPKLNETSSVPVQPIKPPVTISPADSGPQPPVASINFKGGLFKKQFNSTGNHISGNGGLFKSTSGWNEGKYYALIEGIPVGTIVKIAFSSTNKAIYAKVLGGLPAMKESQGLLLRLSDAAASELGISNAKFFVEVDY